MEDGQMALKLKLCTFAKNKYYSFTQVNQNMSVSPREISNITKLCLIWTFYSVTGISNIFSVIMALQKMKGIRKSLCVPIKLYSMRG